MTVNKQLQQLLDEYVVFSDDGITLKDDAPVWVKDLFIELKQNLNIYK